MFLSSSDWISLIHVVGHYWSHQQFIQDVTGFKKVEYVWLVNMTGNGTLCPVKSPFWPDIVRWPAIISSPGDELVWAERPRLNKPLSIHEQSHIRTLLNHVRKNNQMNVNTVEYNYLVG